MSREQRFVRFSISLVLGVSLAATPTVAASVDRSEHVVVRATAPEALVGGMVHVSSVSDAHELSTLVRTLVPEDGVLAYSVPLEDLALVGDHLDIRMSIAKILPGDDSRVLVARAHEMVLPQELRSTATSVAHIFLSIPEPTLVQNLLATERSTEFAHGDESRPDMANSTQQSVHDSIPLAALSRQTTSSNNTGCHEYIEGVCVPDVIGIFDHPEDICIAMDHCEDLPKPDLSRLASKWPVGGKPPTTGSPVVPVPPSDAALMQEALAGPDVYTLAMAPVTLRNCDAMDPFFTLSNCQAGLTGGTPALYLSDDCCVGGSFLLATRDIPWVSAFRGFSTKILGAPSTFGFDSSYKNTWRNAYRFEAGAFKVSGSKTGNTGAAVESTWPERPDCIELPANDPCWNRKTHFTGTMLNYGRDTWRWERWRESICTATGCSSWDVEELYHLQVDGGTEWNSDIFAANYMARPSEIRAGVHGSGAQYARGAIRTYRRQAGSETTWSGGASMKAGKTGFGEVTFTSTMGEQSVQSVWNRHEFRNDKPYWGRWYVYDKKNKNREYWSCEWSAGWVGGSCWSNGA